MARCAICFAADAGYLVPTLVAAGQARRWSDPRLADVLVLGIGLDDGVAAYAGPAFAAAGVRMLRVSADAAGGNAMMARLLLDRLVPAGFAEFLYLDADIQVVASLDPLLSRPVPAGHVRAALDPMAFRVRCGWRNGAARMQAARLTVVLRSSSIMPILIVLRGRPRKSSTRANVSDAKATSSGPCIFGFTI